MSKKVNDTPEQDKFPVDMYRGAPPSDQAAQVRQAIFNFDINDETLKKGIDTDTLIMISKIEGLPEEIITETKRRFENIQNKIPCKYRINKGMKKEADKLWRKRIKELYKQNPEDKKAEGK